MNPDQFINLSGSPDAFSTSDPVYFEVETFGNDAPWTLTVTAPDGSVHSQSGSGNTRYTAPDPLQSGAYKGRVAYDDDSANASATVNVFLTQPSPTPYPTATPSTSPKPGTDPCPEGIRPGDPNLFSKIVDFLTSLGRDDFGIKSILDPGQFDNWGGLKQVFSEEYSKYSQIRIAYTIRINDKVHRLRQIQETIKQNGKDLTPEQKQELVAEKIQVQNDIRSIEADQRKNDQKLKTFDTWDRQINPTQPPCAETANNGGGQPSPEPPRDIAHKFTSTEIESGSEKSSLMWSNMTLRLNL